MSNYADLKVTDIQVFDYDDPETGTSEFSANIAINDSWMIQRGTDGLYSIPQACLAVWNNEEFQQAAFDKYHADAEEIAEALGLDALLEQQRDPGVTV